MARNTNYVEDLASEARNYVDAKVDEVKLRATNGLSLALGKLLSLLLIIAVLIIVLGLLAYALLQWLNVAIGAPWGTFIICGVFAILLVVLYFRKDRMFRDTFVKLFINIFYETPEEKEKKESPKAGEGE